jgi:hypothetical protein
VTYTLMADKAKLSTVAKAKNLYRLTVPLASAAAMVPVMINAHPGGVQQGVLDTKRFVSDWAALSEAADHRKGRYAMPIYAAAVQCAKDNVLNAANATLSPTAANVMMLVHGSPHAIVADIYHVEVAKGVAAFSLRWIKAPKDTPDFGCHAKQDMQKAHYHHRPVSGCELEIAEDIALPGAALRDVARGATLFIKNTANDCYVYCNPCADNAYYCAADNCDCANKCNDYNKLNCDCYFANNTCAALAANPPCTCND